MEIELQSNLCKKYPKIFKLNIDAIYNSANKDFQPYSPIELFGIECGDGWFDILDVACSQIQSIIDYSKGKIPQVIAEQVKEKFGGLRFYFYGGDSATSAVVDTVEQLSYRICERCGKPGKQRGGYWIYTRCDECHKLK